MDKRTAVNFIGQLKDHAKAKNFKDPSIVLSEHTFIDILRLFEVKTPIHIVEYAEKYIFDMPISIIPKHQYDASEEVQKQIPYGTMMIVDRAAFTNSNQ
jgi:hypothetical protein